jgi:hypothetical protein
MKMAYPQISQTMAPIVRSQAATDAFLRLLSPMLVRLPASWAAG